MNMMEAKKQNINNSLLRPASSTSDPFRPKAIDDFNKKIKKENDSIKEQILRIALADDYNVLI